MNKCVFLDRDGVLNPDDPGYSFQLSKFQLIQGVPRALYALKEAGYLLIVVTNQSGISQGIYTENQMRVCHIWLQDACDHVIDHIYFCPYHPTITNSLARKPGSLLFEKAIAKYKIEPHFSWMVGDRGRDLIPARKLGIRTIGIGNHVGPENMEDFHADNLAEAAALILSTDQSQQERRARWRIQ